MPSAALGGSGVLAACLALWLTTAALASPPPSVTAFGLARAANRHVGEQCRDRIVEIYSEKSADGLVPDVWHIVFYDPEATFRSRVVKFTVGKEPTVRRPMRLFEALVGDHLPLDHSQLRIDSDQALKIAAREPGLAGAELKATQFLLIRADEQPVWKIRLWVEVGKAGSEPVAIGEVQVSALDGRVVKSSLQPPRAE